MSCKYVFIRIHIHFGESPRNLLRQLQWLILFRGIEPQLFSQGRLVYGSLCLWILVTSYCCHNLRREVCQTCNIHMNYIYNDYILDIGRCWEVNRYQRYYKQNLKRTFSIMLQNVSLQWQYVVYVSVCATCVYLYVCYIWLCVSVSIYCDIEKITTNLNKQMVELQFIRMFIKDFGQGLHEVTAACGVSPANKTW